MPVSGRYHEHEVDFEEGVRCVVMRCCGFTFDAGHSDDKSDPPTWTCPLCGEGAHRKVLERIAYHEPQDDERAEAMRQLARQALDLGGRDAG